MSGSGRDCRDGEPRAAEPIRTCTAGPASRSHWSAARVLTNCTGKASRAASPAVLRRGREAPALRLVLFTPAGASPQRELEVDRAAWRDCHS
jgi:hypothetical protein